tara:strand:+ start:38489 stop:38935 length:447 start_codon:yes stop_codon:yes gene_type:complete
VSAIRVAIETCPLAPARALGDDGASGARVVFSGQVRDEQGKVQALFLEHYPGMTEAAMENIARAAQQRWPVNLIEIIHRVGELAVGDEIVRVTVCAAHRQAAFEACAFLMDVLKSEVPLWKKVLSGGVWHWVEARDDDARAAARWRAP